MVGSEEISQSFSFSSVWTAQVLAVAATLGLADLLTEGPQSADALAQATATHPEALRRLLWGLTSLGVCAEGKDGGSALTPLGAALRGRAQRRGRLSPQERAG